MNRRKGKQRPKPILTRSTTISKYGRHETMRRIHNIKTRLKAKNMNLLQNVNEQFQYLIMFPIILMPPCQQAFYELSNYLMKLTGNQPRLIRLLLPTKLSQPRIWN